MSVCAICEGIGLVRVVNTAGQWVSRACECQEMEREERRLSAAHIPGRYRDCSLDAYEIYHGADRSLAEALGKVAAACVAACPTAALAWKDAASYKED